MLRTIGKTLGSVLAALCLVATLAVADEMTCTASDGKGNCTTAVGADGKPVVVVGEGLKVGEKMDCVDRGNMIACHAVILASPPPVPFEMTCTASDGKGNCTTAVGTDGKPVVVVGEGLKVGEKMACVDRGNMIACQAL